MKQVSWPYFDPEFCNLPERVHGPSCRVVVDNEHMNDCTVIKVDGVNKQDLLLEVVQVLTDLNLRIVKGYISSDGGWFMDVFHVKDEHGNKITDQRLINDIEQGISSETPSGSPLPSPLTRAEKLSRHNNNNQTTTPFQSHHTTIQMTGSDRPGLFSELSAALADLDCNVIEAHAWSHNSRLACVVYVIDQTSQSPITDINRLTRIEDHLTTVLRGTTRLTHDDDGGGGCGSMSSIKAVELGGAAAEGMISDVERRLHQLMLSVRDFENVDTGSGSGSGCCSPSSSSSSSLCFDPSSSPRSTLEFGREQQQQQQQQQSRRVVVCVDSCRDKGYSVVSVGCRDRPRLMFDTVCTLIDLQYVIFHASVTSSPDNDAFQCTDGLQEYFIRHVDGCPLNTQSEKDRVTKCLEAALERRVCEGVKLELRANNRLGLLSDITRVLRENSLSVVRADVATEGEKAINAFYVRDMSGSNKVDMEFVESVKKEISGSATLQVKNETNVRRECDCEVVRDTTKQQQHHHRLFGWGEALRSQIGRIMH